MVRKLYYNYTEILVSSVSIIKMVRHKINTHDSFHPFTKRFFCVEKMAVYVGFTNTPVVFTLYNILVMNTNVSIALSSH